MTYPDGSPTPPGQPGDPWPGVADLSLIGFDDLPSGQERELDPFRAVILEQVDHPRVNLGSGPPGRVD